MYFFLDDIWDWFQSINTFDKNVMFCNSNIDTSENIPLWWYTNIALTLIYLYWFVVCVSPAQVQDLMYLKSPFPNIHAHTSILNYYYISSRHIYSERSLLIETRMWKTNIYCITLQIHERINGHSTIYMISCNVKVFSRKNLSRKNWHAFVDSKTQVQSCCHHLW